MIEKTDPQRLKNLALPQKLALVLLGIPVLIVFGAYFTDIVAGYKQYIVPLDPWNADKTFWRPALTAVLLVYTGIMFLKQWGYYYKTGQGKSGFFVQTCGIFNDAEWGADILLSFWGGILILAAYGMPSFWLPCASIYFFLVFFRCRITLRRKKYATHWAIYGEAKGPNYTTLWSTFPRSQIVVAAKSAGFLSADAKDTWETRLSVMKDSLDWVHPTAIHKVEGVERPLKVKEILAGWDWIDRMFAVIALVFHLLSLTILKLTHPGLASFSTIVILSGVIFVLHLSLSNASKEWGIKHWHKIVEDEHSGHRDLS
ncbi:MAG: hypothetical protein CHKLHMKO_00088 [Candidatus Argoarchaeum ethanivorans]|uniref:Uncharacterized protein n=1 Tax=Candidatus Argoarchaeum ethanivorans TaxID=2608793 RepID=A0A811T1Y7_9EURY|nr:MAG: hypothetical protein CHKLHMKO_00088 [Candidatus Argoarchaeum ethanivorans]